MTARRQAAQAKTTKDRRELAAQRAMARSAVYRLLSQSLIYPTDEALRVLREADLPAALTLAPGLDDALTGLIQRLGHHVATPTPAALREAYRRIFPHVESGDCPSHELAYTAQNIFQETEDLSDLAGFLRAFGLEVAEHERPDHISVEMEFMYVLTYKEGYALLHHGAEQARLCRVIQRKFVEAHLGRWARRFAELLAGKVEGGHLGAVAALTDAFIDRELALLRAHPEPVVGRRLVQAPDPDEFTCPVAQDCPVAEPGGEDAFA